MPSETFWRALRITSIASWIRCWSAGLSWSRSSSTRRIRPRSRSISSSLGAVFCPYPFLHVGRGEDPFAVGEELLEIGLQLG